MDFLTIAGRLILNVHDLNNEATAGNVSDIRLIDYVDVRGQRREAPAVSGRMLKHWHLSLFADLVREAGGELCSQCLQGEPVRGPVHKDDPKDDAEAAELSVKRCAACDLHGFLVAEGQRSVRRNSRAMFSWLLPVLDEQTETTQRQVVHTRVSRQREREEGEAAAQMLFYKSYASGIYGFVSALDIERLGYMEETQEYVEGVDREQRAKLAIDAYRHMLTGRLGASQSHAIPHADCLELMITISDTGPLPFPVSPIYPGYVAKHQGIVPDAGRLHVYGVEDIPDGVTAHESIGDLFDAVTA